MSPQRSNGEGSLYQRTSSGLWEGSVIFGHDEQGRPIRRTVASKSRAEARRKLNELMRLRDEGLPAPDARLTIEGALRPLRATQDGLWDSIIVPANVKNELLYHAALNLAVRSRLSFTVAARPN
jgi:hypothetical protein